MGNIRKRLKRTLAGTLAVLLATGCFLVSDDVAIAEDTSVPSYGEEYDNLFDDLIQSNVKVTDATNGVDFTDTNDVSNIGFTYEGASNPVVFYDFQGKATTVDNAAMGRYADKLGPESLDAEDTFVYAMKFNLNDAEKTAFFTFRNPAAGHFITQQSGIQIKNGTVELKLMGATLQTYSGDFRDGSAHTLVVKSSPDKVSVWIDETLVFDDADYDLDELVAKGTGDNETVKNEDETYTMSKRSVTITDVKLYPVFGFYFNGAVVTISEQFLSAYGNDYREYENLFDGLETSEVRVNNNGAYSKVFSVKKSLNEHVAFTFDTVNNVTNGTDRASANDVIYYDFNNKCPARWDGLGWYANQLRPEGLSASDTFVYATDFKFSSDSTNGFFLFRSPKCETANNNMSFQSGVHFHSDGKVYLRILGASLGVYDKNYKDGTTHTLKIESSPDKVSVWIDEEKIFDNIEYNLDAVMAANDSENPMVKNEDGSYRYRTSYIYTDTTMYPAFGFYFNTVNVKVNNPLLYVSETAVIDKKLLDVKVQFKDDIRTYDNLFDGLTTDRVVVSLDGNTTVNTDKNGNVTFTTAGKNYIYYALGETIVAGNESGSGIGLYAKQLGPTGISTEDILIYETDFNISGDGKVWFTFRAPYSGNTGMACQTGVNITSSGVNLMILGATLNTYSQNYADGNTHTMKVKSGSDKVSVWIDGTLIFNDVDYDLDAVVAKTEMGTLVYSETTNGMKYEEGQYWYRGNALEGNVMYPAFGFFTGSATEQMTISNPVLYEYDESTSAKYAVRFIGSVDKLAGYESAGFILSTKDPDPQFGNGCKEITGIKTVYSDLYVNGVLTSAKDIYEDEHSQYVFAYDIGNLPRGKNVYVRAYVQLSNGNIVLGNVRTITVAAPVLDDVYVATTGANDMSRGSEDKPFATLEYALKQVADKGTIHIVDSYTATSSFVWKSHEKQITITGGTLDFSAISRLNILDAVTFTDMTINLRSGGHVFANGNSLKIDSNVTVNNVALLYGAGDTGTTVESTNIIILAGTYDKIYGGGYEADVQKDTTVYIGGNVNSGINATDHSLVYNLYGGSHNGTVGGNTNITVCDSAKFSYVYGGGRDTSEVTKRTSVKLQNSVAVYGVYGGSNSGSVGDTLVEMTGGTVYQVFGGSSGADVQGNTDVRITGGIIQRRIYGGCYNDYSPFTWKSSYRVYGNSSVTLGGTVNLAFQSSEDDIGLFATSRYKSALPNEKGTIIFNDGTYSSLKEKLGSQDTLGSLVVGSQEYHYLVDASGDGAVYAEGTNLRIVPKEGYTATVTVNGSSTTLTSEGTYTLPMLSSNTATATIKVVFSQP